MRDPNAIFTWNAVIKNILSTYEECSTMDTTSVVIFFLATALVWFDLG